MPPVTYYSTNNKNERVNFETALLAGQPNDYGLFMMDRKDVPKLRAEEIEKMSGMSYARIAFQVLNPFLGSEISENELQALLDDAYAEDKIPTKVQSVIGKTHIMWLTQGPTYSFKDCAARFFGRALSHFLKKRELKRTVVVATSGDTGGAVANALHNLENIDNIVFFPRGSVSDGQRRQMTTLGGNVHAFEVNGDFDVCQALAKNILGDKDFAESVFGDRERITSANSISLGRLLPQMVFPFFAYSRIARDGQSMLTSIPSGNFGDMMGTVIAKEMGLPISKIICGVNENTEFPDFLETGKYEVMPSKKSPSSAMVVSHPSNLARLVDFYGGHIYDQRNPDTKRITKPGVIDKMPDIDEMKKDIFSVGIGNEQHYSTIKKVFDDFGVILDPHGAVGWEALKIYNNGDFGPLAVVYETADPGKFPKDVERAMGIIPDIPKRMKEQAELPEKIHSIGNSPNVTEQGMRLSDAQISEAKKKIKELLS